MTSDPPGTPWMFRGLYNRRKPRAVPAFVYLFVGAVLLFFGIQAIRSGLHNERWLTAHGTRTDARLDSLSCSGRPVGRLSLASGNCAAYGVFSFHTAAGKEANARIYVARHYALKVGDRVPIEYNPNNPANAQTVEGNGESSNSAAGLGLVFVIIGGTVVIVAVLKGLRLGDRRLAHELKAEDGSAET